MKSVNTILRDKQLHHVIAVEGFNRQLDRELQKILQHADKDISTLIRAGSHTEVDKMITVITKRVNKAYTSVFSEYKHQIIGFADNEVNFQSDVLRNNVGDSLKLRRVSKADIRAAVITKPLHVGDIKAPRTFRRHVASLAKSEIVILSQGIRTGLVRGDTLDEIVDKLYKTKGFTAPNRLTRHQLRTITRTSITDIQTYVTMETFRKNRDIIKHYKYISTLDDRTSPICQRLDGLVSIVGEGPRPPQHYQCRSTIIPVVKNYDEIPKKHKKGKPSPEVRASMDGAIPATESYQSWLSGQGTAVQDGILGVAQADVFRRQSPHKEHH